MDLNPESFTNRTDKKRGRARFIVQQAKSVACADCKGKYPYYMMDLDHINSGDKAGNISDIARNGSLEQLRLELLKVQAVCANCHRIRSFYRQRSGTIAV